MNQPSFFLIKLLSLKKSHTGYVPPGSDITDLVKVIKHEVTTSLGDWSAIHAAVVEHMAVSVGHVEGVGGALVTGGEGDHHVDQGEDEQSSQHGDEPGSL